MILVGYLVEAAPQVLIWWGGFLFDIEVFLHFMAIFKNQFKNCVEKITFYIIYIFFYIPNFWTNYKYTRSKF